MSLHTTPSTDPITPDAAVAVPIVKKRPARPVPKTEEPSAPEFVDGRPSSNTSETWKLGLDWPVVIWIGVIHVFALAAPFFFTWQALVVCAALILATGSLGVCMGYHRLLTHGSFKTYKPVRWLLAFLGGLSGEGSALAWVANHRKHHKYSDQEGDPHSPRHGKWWSHMTWFMPNWGEKLNRELLERYAGDMLKDRMMKFLHVMFLPTHLILGVGLFLLGYFGTFLGLAGGLYTGLSMMFWGMGVRMVYVMHVTWFVNSATHLWGYRTYETTDDSKNNWWVGFLAFGEGWHNNHHAYQRVASQGHRWWEIDTTYWLILAMEKVGLAWDVIRLGDVRRASSVG
ncbi:MAG: acyl-CoA desaturase [Aeoliella sp.]